MTKIYDKNLLKICITLLLVVCSLHLPKINEFCLRIQMLPAKMQVGLTLAGPPRISEANWFSSSCPTGSL